MVILLPSTATRTIIVAVLEVDTKLTIIAPDTVAQGASFNIAGILQRVDNNDPIPGVMVTVSYNGTTLGNIFTDDLGRYLLSTSIDMPGTFTLTTSFAGAEIAGLTLNPSMATRGIGTGLAHLPIAPIAIIAGALLLLSRR